MSNHFNAPPGLSWGDPHFYDTESTCPDCDTVIGSHMDECEVCGRPLTEEDFEPEYWDGAEWEAA